MHSEFSTGSADHRAEVEQRRRVGNERLRFAAGNLFVNDKPTDAVMGRQPFGGTRA